jgi:VanZ family protein
MANRIDTSGPLFRWRWLIWSIYVALWTTALVVPIPGDTFLERVQVLRITLKFLLAKTLHVLAYGGMTILSGRLLVPPRYRWAVMYFLMLHAGATEFTQLHLVYRSGLLMDVMFDSLGIALGVLASWRYWTAPELPRPLPMTAPDEEEACAPLR